MRENKDALNKALDELIKEAACLVNEREGMALEDPTEEITFSVEHEKKMRKLFKEERRKENIRKFSKYAKSAACILLAVGIISGVSIFSVEAWRAKFMNFMFDSVNPNTDFSFGVDMQQCYVDENISLANIPSGFELKETDIVRSMGSYFFKNGEKFFQFSYASINAKSSVDTENGVIENISINGMEGVYISTPRLNSLVWHDDEYSYVISANISKEEIVKIAQNCQKF